MTDKYQHFKINLASIYFIIHLRFFGEGVYLGKNEIFFVCLLLEMGDIFFFFFFNQKCVIGKLEKDNNKRKKEDTQ
jgi:hypothetical protein